MADTPSLLGYQTSYELRLFDLATNSQQMGDWPMACFWARQHAEFVGSDKIPNRPPIPPNSNQASIAYREYFEKLMGSGLQEVKKNVERVRAMFRNRKDIPRIDRDKLGSDPKGDDKI